MNNKTEIDYLNYNDLNLVEEKIKECTDRANEAMSPQINKVIDGKSTQETRSGKNLLNYIDNLISNANGLTNTINPDGSITTTGKPARNYVTIIKSIAMTDLLEDKQVYTISNEKPGKIYVQVNAMKNDGTYTYYNSYNGKTSFTVDKSLYKSYTVVIQTATMSTWGDSSLTITNKYMLCKGTDTVFEKYGASPSPDYPSEIENMKGKNLFDGGETTTNNGITFTKNEDGTYNIKGTATAQANCYNFIDINKSNIVNGETYTLWQSIKIPGVYILIEVYNGNTWIRHMLTNTTLPVTHIANISGGNRIRLAIRVAKDVTVDVKNLQIQLEKGSVATRYVPYGNIQIVETGENLWQPYSNTTSNGITLTQKNNGNILLNGTATGDTFLRITLNKFINGATTLSCNYKSGTIKGASVFVRTRTSKLILNHSIIVSPTTPIGIKLEHKTVENYYQEITIQKGAILSNVLLEVMFLKGTYNETNLPDYKPYTEEVVNIDLKGNELCSLPNGTKDELIVKDGRAKIVKKIGEVVLDGSKDESWVKRNDGDGGTTISFTYNISNIGTTNQINNRFQNGTSSIDGIECLGIPSQLIQIYIQIKRNRLSTLDVTGFKAWLQANPVVLQYELEEPYEIDLGPLEVYFTYETKKWEINELPYIQEIDRIEKGIYNLGEKYNRPKGWLPTKEWITKDNLYPIKSFDYRDWNRWVNNLNIFITDIVVKDTIWNGASFINWEQIGKDEWR